MMMINLFIASQSECSMELLMCFCASEGLFHYDFYVYPVTIFTIYFVDAYFCIGRIFILKIYFNQISYA